MSGTGDSAKYTRLRQEAPLSKHEKDVLKKKVDDLIDAATKTISIIVLEKDE